MRNDQNLQSAIECFQTGNIKLATEILDNYLLSHPMDVNANLLSAGISAVNFDYVGVVRKCKKILDIDPGNIKAGFNAAVASENLHNYDDVLYFSSLVLQCDAVNVLAKLLYINALYRLGKLTQSLLEASKIIVDNKGSVEVTSKINRIFLFDNNNVALEKIYQNVLKLDSLNMGALFNLVLLSVKKQDIVSAEIHLNKLRALDKENVNTKKAQVEVLYAKNAIDECIHYIEGLSQDSHKKIPEIMMKLAQCYSAIADNHKAISLYENSINMNMNVVESYHNIGLIEDRLGNLEHAIYAYQSAIAIAPDSLTSNFNLAFLLNRTGNKKSALSYIHKCYKKRNTPGIRQAYVEILSTAKINQLNNFNEEFILNVATDEEVDAQALSSLFFDQLKKSFSLINKLCDKAIDNDFTGFCKLLKNNIDELSKSRMLHKLFVNFSVTSFEVENFIKMFRKALLLKYIDINNVNINDLCAAMAIHCYIDGYVFTVSAEEGQLITKLTDTIKNTSIALNKKDVLLLSMYVSLYEISKKNETSTYIAASLGDYKKLIKLQIDDNLAEEKLRYTIKNCLEISDETSLTVQQQYEKNPYPVWQKLNVRQPELISDIIQKVTLFTGGAIPVFNNPDILVAGCGTGSHVIQTAMRIKHNSITTLDLSRRSLAFAKRKAIEYNFDYIDFNQLDILNVSSLDKKFDLIESVGVLHHMQNPLTGFKCLVDVLKQDGLLNIGLYSKIGRRYIIKAKLKYDDPSKYVSDDEIRKFRLDLMKSDDEKLKNNISGYKDFYSLHDCRDMIFHENENNYDINELDKLIDDAGLRFIGFDISDSSVLAEFTNMFPENNSYSEIKNWAIFENKYPDTFASMYIFWCRKK